MFWHKHGMLTASFVILYLQYVFSQHLNNVILITLTNGHSYYCLCKKGNFNVGYVECLLSSICFRCFLIWDRLHHLHVQFLALNHQYALQIVTGIREHWMFYTKSYVRLVNIHIWVYGKICFITQVSKYFWCLAAGLLQCHYTFWNDRSK